MKPFNLELAKEGAKVCTRDGRPARIICFDRKHAYPIVALVQHEFKKYEEDLTTHCNDGKRCPTQEQRDDLFMAPEKKEGWIVIYSCGDPIAGRVIYKTKEEARKDAVGPNNPQIVKIEWEE